MVCSQPAMDPMLGTFLRLAAEHPTRPAALASDRIRTRAELANGALTAAAGLAAAGLPPGAVVGLVAAGPSFLEAWLACRAAGLCTLLLDDGAPDAELAAVAERFGAWAVWRSDEPFERSAVRAGAVQPDGAAIKLSSGTTGDAGGILVGADALCADGRAIVSSMGIEERDRIVAAIPLGHSYGFSVVATPAWITGCCIVFPDGDDAFAAAQRHDATVLPSVPAWYRARLASSAVAPASLRLFVSAAAPLGPETARAWRERHGRPIQVLYGSSECGSITFDRRGDAAERGTVGTPLDGVRVELADGTVSVVSPAVALRYVPAERPGGARIENGRFDTEDLGSFDDAGELVLHGRRSDWINVKGHKVDPREVESVLAELPGVAEAVVVGVPLPDERGETIRAVVACETGSLGYHDIVAWCRERVAAHKVPRSVVLVDAIPRSARGKIDLAALRAL